ncbi:uncharacterized protein [Clytia hemisphaerica]|uniref:Death domain-containing protein n=1 Tax=Clytia hemisphaerica TaxID=252671 RepID=A0A7M5VGS7_9CNID|eukprot:TCONS_00010709-protein
MAARDGNQENQGIVTIVDLLNDDDIRSYITSEMDDYTNRWFLRLAEWLIKHKHTRTPRKKFKCLERDFHGGGSPTSALLNKMKVDQPQATVGQLKKCAKKNQRMDVMEVLQTNNDDVLISDLLVDDGIIAQIYDCLDERVVGAPDWSSFASYFGYTFEVIEKFRGARTTPGLFSPTMALLRILWHENQNLSIQHIITWARDAGRNDIGNRLEAFTTSILANRNNQRPESGNNTQADPLVDANFGYTINVPATEIRPVQCQDTALSGQDANDGAVRSPPTESTDIPDVNSQDERNEPRGNPDGVDEELARDVAANLHVNDGCESNDLPPGVSGINEDGEPELT